MRVVLLVALLASGDLRLTWESARTQPDLNEMAGRNLDVARREMESELGRVLALAKADPAQVKRLHAAQDAWEAYRAAQMDALLGCENPKAAYGSVFPMCHRLAEKSMVERRTAELADMGNRDDGELCGWLPTCAEP